ncbi:homoserine kinase [Altericroceibacterium spongiae]|uniref:Homoserine kinase n=1 Tax=Altericroceibacterium spongiae TaxID=2320269 RepID=A0A420EKB6_9SPHN|nr:homoserine kinase [Altericroceibacterium spongiae]RKF21128.1 homoserine kinase [Altericroceibacterium spongiae]
MAVYTHLSADDFARLLSHYDVGDVISSKGIAEGVSNSNWLIDTTGGRFILTMYENRVELDDLPFFLGLLDHLAAKGSPVPRTIHDRDGAPYRMMDGKAVALIEFLSGVSIDTPTPAQAEAVGIALAGLHIDAQDFPQSRANSMGLSAWRDLFGQCGKDGLASIDPALPALVADRMDFLAVHWPDHLPQSVIHADLFPDNVLMLGDEVRGLIDFYFACNDLTAYDLAVTHAAWSFTADGTFREDIATALIAGYQSRRPLTEEERDALPVLGQAAAMRFIATRAYDWLNTPADALVTRKDPMDFARRLQFYAQNGAKAFPGAFPPAAG